LQLIEALRDASREGILSSWNMLSSHDTPRLANLLPQAWQRWLALVLQFTTPGVPVVYYGEEVGMQGGFDPDCRRPMLWDASDWSPETVGWYRTLIELRRTRRELREGCFIALSHVLNTETVAFIRHTDVPQEVSLVAVNPSDKPFKAVLLLPYPHLYHDLPLRDALGSHSHLKMGAGSVDVEVAPRSAAVWVPDDSRYRNYTFFKGA
jgi:alpha-glucosidase